MREVANVEIEKLRKQKVVGTSLEALVHVTAGGETLALLEQYREVLDTLFIAQVRLESDANLEVTKNNDDVPAGQVFGEAFQLQVERAEGTRCERCWRYVSNVAVTPKVEGLCTRCVEMLKNQ